MNSEKKAADAARADAAKPVSQDLLRKMIASGKSVQSKATSK